MSELAIRAEGLGKKYNVGQRRNVTTFSESLNNLLLRSLRRNPNMRSTDSKPFWALRDVSFELKHGEVLGLIGRNGSGKSTLLKILSRITRPTEGSLEVRGRVRPLLEVGIGFHPELTGRVNVYLSGSILGIKRTDINSVFDEIVAFSGIENFIDTPVKFYSSGMYIRLAFSVSVHLEPDIILIDEILAVGDTEFQKKCLKKIDQIRRQGRTIMLVSHNVMQLAELASRVIWLESGRIVEQGNPRTVTSNYLASEEVESSLLSPKSENSLELPGSSEPLGEKAIPLGQVAFNPPQGTNGVRILRSYVTDCQSQIGPKIPYEKSFCLVIEYEVEGVIPGLCIGITLHNERDQVVIYTLTTDHTSIDGTLAGSSGMHRASIQMPGAWFVPGRYFVEAGFWSPGSGHHFLRSNIFAFDINSAPLAIMGYEVLRPTLSWDIQTIPNETPQPSGR